MLLLTYGLLLARFASLLACVLFRKSKMDAGDLYGPFQLSCCFGNPFQSAPESCGSPSGSILGLQNCSARAHCNFDRALLPHNRKSKLEVPEWTSRTPMHRPLLDPVEVKGSSYSGCGCIGFGPKAKL